MNKTLQDVKVGDVVVQPKPYSSDWQRLEVVGVTPARVRTATAEWSKSNGASRGYVFGDVTGIVYADDHPAYLQWLADNAALAERLAPLLHKLPASDLRQLAAKLGVKP